MLQKIGFSSDEFRLNGTLHLPETKRSNNGVPVVIGSHGMLSDGESPKQKALAARLNKQGIAFFRFDHRGRGESEGAFSAVTTFQARVNDLAAAISTALAHPGITGPPGLFGSSMGGAVCLGIAGCFEIRTIVTLAAPVRLKAIRLPEDITEYPLFRNMQPEQMAFDVSEKLGYTNNILIFHGDADEVVPYENALEIYEKAHFPKKLVRFPGGDHAVSNPGFQQQFMDEAVEWLTSGLSGSPENS